MNQSNSEALERVFTDNEKASAMRDAVFVARELVGIDFSRADLSGATFDRVLIATCSFVDANLSGAVFANCDLQNVDLSGANLQNARFDGTTYDDRVRMTDTQRAHLEGAGATKQLHGASQR